jgi:hypothetical protein
MINTYEELDEAAINASYETIRWGKTLAPLPFTVSEQCLQQTMKYSKLRYLLPVVTGHELQKVCETELLNGIQVVLTVDSNGSRN